MGGENSRIAGSGTIEHLAKKGKVTMFVGKGKKQLECWMKRDL
jgi:hypothetical protein